MYFFSKKKYLRHFRALSIGFIGAGVLIGAVFLFSGMFTAWTGYRPTTGKIMASLMVNIVSSLFSALLIMSAGAGINSCNSSACQHLGNLQISAGSLQCFLNIAAVVLSCRALCCRAKVDTSKENVEEKEQARQEEQSQNKIEGCSGEQWKDTDQDLNQEQGKVQEHCQGVQKKEDIHAKEQKKFMQPSAPKILECIQDKGKQTKSRSSSKENEQKNQSASVDEQNELSDEMQPKFDTSKM